MKTAYPQYQGTTNIRLYSNIPFDNSYQHHSIISRYFVNGDGDEIYSDAGDTKGLPKERFINRKKLDQTYYYPRYNITGEFNFDYSNGLVCSVVLELTPEQTNANYMRVESHNNNGREYYYYFITGITQVNADTYRLSLELDVLMTYQDEFLNGIGEYPVMTNRKHCHRFCSNGHMPYSSDLKTGEDTFAGVKPSIIEGDYALSYKYLDDFEDVLWLYICADTSQFDFSDYPDTQAKITFTCNEVQYPFIILALPLNAGLIIKRTDDSVFATYTKEDIKKMIATSLINNGSIKGSKISPYPPFGTYDSVEVDGSGNVVMTASQETFEDLSLIQMLDFKTNTDNEYVAFKKVGGTWEGSFIDVVFGGAFILCNFYQYGYEMSVDSSFDDLFKYSVAPDIQANRVNDPKLLFAPFKKYVLMAQYTSDGCELYPELLFSEFVTDYNYGYSYFNFETFTTPYIGDNSIFTFLKPIFMPPSSFAFSSYQYNRIGLSGSMNYTIPVGENALDVFNATQQQSFYQSKVASGITSGLTIAGGIGSIVLGATMGVSSAGALTPMGAGLIAGGASAIAGGIASMANTIKSTNAKIEDLKNTPDSVSVAGSNFLSDYTINKDFKCHPFIAVYGVADIIKKQANDFFYNYGYQVGRECYFNKNLSYTPADKTTDDNIFGRQIFNYVQLNEDITNKINNDMPIIIKQKLSKIFNQGITLWTFFGNPSLWSSSDSLGNYDPDKWFMKCIKDNTEY